MAPALCRHLSTIGLMLRQRLASIPSRPPTMQAPCVSTTSCVAVFILLAYQLRTSVETCSMRAREDHVATASYTVSTAQSHPAQSLLLCSDTSAHASLSSRSDVDQRRAAVAAAEDPFGAFSGGEPLPARPSSPPHTLSSPESRAPAAGAPLPDVIRHLAYQYSFEPRPI